VELFLFCLAKEGLWMVGSFQITCLNEFIWDFELQVYNLFDLP
jgi:hypothetical protein